MGKKGKKNFWTKKKVVILLFGLAIILTVGNYFLEKEVNSLTGYGTSSIATVGFTILGGPNFEIIEPENITYNFSASDDLVLNLTGISDSPMDDWVYHLYDLRHGEWAHENFSFGSNCFFPNTTIPVVRWENLLFVEGDFGTGITRKNVTFYVNVSNSRPILGPIDDPIYICEGERLSYFFNATDADEENLFSQIIPSYPLYSEFLYRDREFNFFRLSSPALRKNSPIPFISLNEGFRNNSLQIEVRDNYYESDYTKTNILVVEKNNAPVIVPELGVQTIEVWNKGENSSFFVDVNFSDVEISLGFGELNFSLNIVNLSDLSLVDIFDIDSEGIINFTADEETPLGNYNVSVCVTDYGILNPYFMIEDICNQTGGNITVCDSFILTLTDRNRAPTIVEHFPSSDEKINTTSIQTNNFNITKYDPDGTIPDSYWYVDGKFVEMMQGSLNDSFSYTFGCGISGEHKIKVEITDGLLNDSVEWNLSVAHVSCPVPGSSGGGGGGGGGSGCVPEWVCTSWDVCQHARSSLDLGLISGENYRFVSESCESVYFGEERCGYQVRMCNDFNFCNRTTNKPAELQFCLYTANPTCKDGIQNCHDGFCELLIDCGGPCDPCATCSDGIKNQGEEGVDCGGPCPWKCKPEIPLIKRNYVIYIFLIILLAIVVGIIIKLINVLKYKKAIDSNKKPNV